jgi:hypothetical protein
MSHASTRATSRAFSLALHDLRTRAPPVAHDGDRLGADGSGKLGLPVPAWGIRRRPAKSVAHGRFTPPAWGIQVARLFIRAERRSTPTRVSNTQGDPIPHFPEQVHPPHARGEYRSAMVATSLPYGSPPPAWGIRSTGRWRKTAGPRGWVGTRPCTKTAGQWGRWCLFLFRSPAWYAITNRVEGMVSHAIRRQAAAPILTANRRASPVRADDVVRPNSARRGGP